ncbi:uncharacterized protein [Montipora capricornis]|uniref:uncharacterized protein n=1 Tax=Montipora capricornis TaxID=246305 RepID=UPI0035F1AD30
MIFSLCQLQENCREQQQPLFLAFVDLTKAAFDLVSRSGLFKIFKIFKILQKIGYPSKLLAIITSFHQDMQSTVCFDGANSNAFPVSSGVKQGCVLAPTLFGIFFSMLLQYAFVDFTEGVYVWTSLRKTNILTQSAEFPPVITIGNTELEVVDTFTYLGSTVSSSTSLDAEISCRIAKAAAVMAKLNKRVWDNDLLRERTKMCVYQACVLSTLLYGSESWTTYARQEQRTSGGTSGGRTESPTPRS